MLLPCFQCDLHLVAWLNSVCVHCAWLPGHNMSGWTNITFLSLTFSEVFSWETNHLLQTDHHIKAKILYNVFS